MRSYLTAMAAGLLVGVIYGLLRVRSPAPPLVALVGLLGILIGEQIPSALNLVRHGSGPAAQTLQAPAPSTSKPQDQP